MGPLLLEQAGQYYLNKDGSLWATARKVVLAATAWKEDNLVIRSPFAEPEAHEAYLSLRRELVRRRLLPPPALTSDVNDVSAILERGEDAFLRKKEADQESGTTVLLTSGRRVRRGQRSRFWRRSRIR